MITISHQGGTLVVVNTLDETDLLTRNYQGLVSTADRRRAQTLLKDLHDKHLWVGCDCLETSLEDRPMLFVRRSHKGNYGLVRMTDRAQHDKTCPFLWDEGGAALLAQLCIAGDLNAVYPNTVREHEPTERYHELAGAYEDIEDFYGIPLFTHPGGAMSWARKQSGKHAKAYLLTAVDRVEKGRVEIHQKKVDFKIPIDGAQSWMMLQGEPEPPYLALLEITPGDRGVIAHKAWLTQITDKGVLVPIQNARHRKSWKTLMHELYVNESLRKLIEEIRYFLPGDEMYGHATLQIMGQYRDVHLVDLLDQGEEPRNSLYHSASSEHADQAFIRALFAALKSCQ